MAHNINIASSAESVCSKTDYLIGNRTGMSLLVLSYSDVAKITSTFTPIELQTLMGRVFALVSDKRSLGEQTQSVTPHRTSVPTLKHTALLMPARIVDSSMTGTTLKVVCIPTSKNDNRGLPASTLVIDEKTGALKAVLNARNLTALRNAAGSLLSTSLVGPQFSRRIVAFGSGKQIEAHLDLHLRFFASIKECVVIVRSINPRAKALITTLITRFTHVSFTLLEKDPTLQQDDPQVSLSVKNADLIICATPSTVPLFPSSWVRTGTHIILIGSYTPAMREAERDLILRAVPKSRQQLSDGYRQILLVDSKEACAREAGELIDAGLSEDCIKEIGELVPRKDSGDVDILIESLHLSDEKVIRDDTGDYSGPVTIFKSVGIGLQDAAIALAVLRRAEDLGHGVMTVVEEYDEM